MTFLESIRQWFRKLGSNKTMVHLVLWMTVLFALMLSDSGRYGFFFTFLLESINTLFYAALCYVNIYYLIPKYLVSKRYLKYIIYLLITTIVATPIKLFFLFKLFENLPSAQSELILNQNYYFLINYMVLIASSVVKITSDWITQEREKQELKTRTVQSELQFLKSQINPHFLFNTLNSLYAMTLKKSDDAPDIVLKLSEMLRYMLYECNEKWVPLSKEIAYIENYLELEKLRQSKAVDIKFDVIGEVEGQLVAPLLFITFIENSFKHGLNQSLHNPFVHIMMLVKENTVQLDIENSKPEDAPMPKPKKSGGIGLVNVKRRLDILYDNRYALDIQETPKTYTVHLTLDL